MHEIMSPKAGMAYLPKGTMSTTIEVDAKKYSRQQLSDPWS